MGSLIGTYLVSINPAWRLQKSRCPIFCSSTHSANKVGTEYSPASQSQHALVMHGEMGWAVLGLPIVHNYAIGCTYLSPWQAVARTIPMKSHQ